MRIKNRITTAFGMMAVTLCLFAGEAFGSQPTPVWPYGLRFETASDASAGGPNVLRIFVSSNRGCDSVQLEITEIHHLGYSGPRKITRLIDRDTIVIYLAVDIPPNDTSGFEFRFTGCDRGQPDKAFWVLGGDSVEFYRGDPRLWAPIPRLGPPKGRNLMKPPPYTGPTIRRGYTDKDGNFIEGKPPKKEPPVSKYIGKINPDDTTMMAWKRNDSGWLELIKVSDVPTKRDLDIEKMREKEKTPLTEFDVQHIMVGDEIWGRNKGEYKFTKVVTTTNPFAASQREADSLRALTNVKQYDLIIDLRDTADYNFASSLVGKLEPTDSSGLFRAIMGHEEFMELQRFIRLQKRRLRYAPFPQYPEKQRRGNRRVIKGEVPVKSGTTNPQSGDISPNSSESQTLFPI